MWVRYLFCHRATAYSRRSHCFICNLLSHCIENPATGLSTSPPHHKRPCLNIYYLGNTNEPDAFITGPSLSLRSDTDHEIPRCLWREANRACFPAARAKTWAPIGAVNGPADRGWPLAAALVNGIGCGAIARHCAPASASVAITAPVALSAQTRGHSRYGASFSFRPITRKTWEKRAIRRGKRTTIQRLLARL
jgi:hypothetical protein